MSVGIALRQQMVSLIHNSFVEERKKLRSKKNNRTGTSDDLDFDSAVQTLFSDSHFYSLQPLLFWKNCLHFLTFTQM